MRNYKAYVPGDDGHIIDRVDLVCDDEAAKDKARKLAIGQAVEL
ncbi:hypothetical protein [Bradyrhizobium sp. CCBAU 53421]|nr:hypothetical protein [Bradyrhizobium sp. CCBAU 53421]